MAAVHNFTGLMLARFFVGFVEAVFFPGALYYMSLFYNRKQFAFRTSIMYSGSQLGNAFGGLLAIGIVKLDGVHGIQGWRWVSLFHRFLASSPLPRITKGTQRGKARILTITIAIPARRRSNGRPRYYFCLCSTK